MHTKITGKYSGVRGNEQFQILLVNWLQNKEDGIISTFLILGARKLQLIINDQCMRACARVCVRGWVCICTQHKLGLLRYWTLDCMSQITSLNVATPDDGHKSQKVVDLHASLHKVR